MNTHVLTKLVNRLAALEEWQREVHHLIPEERRRDLIEPKLERSDLADLHKAQLDRYEDILTSIDSRQCLKRARALLTQFTSPKLSGLQQDNKDIGAFIARQSPDDIKLIKTSFQSFETKAPLLRQLLDRFQPHDIEEDDMQQHFLAQIYALLTGRRIAADKVLDAIEQESSLGDDRFAEEAALLEFATSVDYSLDQDIFERIKHPIKLLHAILIAGYKGDGKPNYPRLEHLLKKFEEQYHFQFPDIVTNIPGGFLG